MTRLLGVVVVGLLALAPSLWGEEPADLLARQERQRQIQADTDLMVRRISAMLRVMEYYQLDKNAERQMLQEVATTLGALSRDQMTAVIAKLDAAAREPNAARSQKEADAAYAKHREVMASLRGLLAAYDAVKSLDQAAERLEKAARDQVELALQSIGLVQDYEDERSGALRRYSRRGGDNIYVRAQRLADDQGDFRADTGDIWRQTTGLKPQLPAEQAPRLERAVALFQDFRLLETMTKAAQRLQASGYDSEGTKGWEKAYGWQWQSAGELLELSSALREP